MTPLYFGAGWAIGFSILMQRVLLRESWNRTMWVALITFLLSLTIMLATGTYTLA